MRRPRVALLLGKPPERSPVVPEVIDALRRSGADVRVHLPKAGDPLPPWLPGSGVAALRGLHADVLAAVAEAEANGLRCCNPALATLAVRDRGHVQRRLVGARVPVPAGAEVMDVVAARAWAKGRPVAVKAADATVGRAAGVIRWSHPDDDEAPPMPGPYLVQEWVPGDGVDRKMYVMGARTAGLLKSEAVGGRTGTPFEPGHQLLTLARDVGRALDLRVYGVDVVAGPGGPIVVDVNAFPSCRGVRGAARAIAETLLAQASR